jgi:hypothetical protein
MPGEYALTEKINGFSPVPNYNQQIGKFPPDTVLQLPRSAKTVFLHRGISRLPHAKIQFLHSSGNVSIY